MGKGRLRRLRTRRRGGRNRPIPGCGKVRIGQEGQHTTIWCAVRIRNRVSEESIDRGKFLWLALLLLLTAMGCRGRHSGCYADETAMPPLGSPPAPARVITTRHYTLQEIEEALWPRRRDVAFAPPSPALEAALAELVPVLATTPPAAFAHTPDAMALAGRADSVGLALELWKVTTAWFWVLRERDDRQRGVGAYIFRATAGGRGPSGEKERSGSAAPAGKRPLVVLQAPHSYFDRHTGSIAAAIFFGQSTNQVRVDALMTNSLHRYQQTADRRYKGAENPSDACHNPNHPFQLVTEQIAKAAGGRHALFVQLHGFGKRDREDGGQTDPTGKAPSCGEGQSEDDPIPGDRSAMESIELIVSTGKKTGSSALSTAVGMALGHVFGREVVRRYPEEIRILGGTTNVQGRMLHKHNYIEFLHIEMSARVRKRLLTSPELLHRFATAVLGRDL